MRIHFLVVILSVIATVLLTWSLSTKARIEAMMSPRNTPLPLEDFGESDLFAVSDEPVPLTKPSASPLNTNPRVPLEEEIPSENLIDLDPVEAAPSLAEYRELAKGADPSDLFKLSSQLRTQGHFQRALLVLERIIDSSKANPAQLEEAAQGIAALTPTLPQWTVDPIEELPLVLNLGVSQLVGEVLDTAANEVAGLIRNSSGEILLIQTKIHTPPKKSPAAVESPIALWISLPGEDPPSTAVITFKPAEEPEALVEQIALAAFRAARAHLAKHGYPLPPALKAEGKQLLTSYFTRLMWQTLATSLQNPPEE